MKVEDIEQYFTGVTTEGAMAYRKIFEIGADAMAVSDRQPEGLGQRVMLYAQHGQVGPLAIVAGSDESYAQAQVFAQAATAGRPLQIFREMHAARRWLDEQDSATARSEWRADDARQHFRLLGGRPRRLAQAGERALLEGSDHGLVHVALAADGRRVGEFLGNRGHRACAAASGGRARWWRARSPPAPRARRVEATSVRKSFSEMRRPAIAQR